MTNLHNQIGLLASFGAAGLETLILTGFRAKTQF